MNYEACTICRSPNELYRKIKQAELEAEQTDIRYTHDEVMKEVFQILTQISLEK